MNRLFLQIGWNKKARFVPYQKRTVFFFKEKSYGFRQLPYRQWSLEV